MSLPKNYSWILSRIRGVTIDGFGYMTRFIDHLYNTDSEIQVITEPQIISKIHKSLEHPLSIFPLLPSATVAWQ
jgi:hypothetical protein